MFFIFRNMSLFSSSNILEQDRYSDTQLIWNVSPRSPMLVLHVLQQKTLDVKPAANMAHSLLARRWCLLWRCAIHCYYTSYVSTSTLKVILHC